MLGFGTPKISVGGDMIELAPALKWYQLVLCALPMLLILAGGITGLVCGLVAMQINFKLVASTRPSPIKHAMVLGVSLLASALDAGAGMFLLQLRS